MLVHECLDVSCQGGVTVVIRVRTVTVIPEIQAIYVSTQIAGQNSALLEIFNKSKNIIKTYLLTVRLFILAPNKP